MNKEKQSNNSFENIKKLVLYIKNEKQQLKIKLDELERLEKEMVLILSNPKITKDILKGE